MNETWDGLMGLFILVDHADVTMMWLARANRGMCGGGFRGKWRRDREKWQRSVSVGIDFGTCRSAIAVVESGEARMMEFSDGKKQISSTALSTKDGLIPIALAGDEENFDPRCVISNAKRLMGHSFSDVKKQSFYFPYSIEDSPSDQSIIIKTPFQQIKPEQVAGTTIAYLIQTVEKRFKQSVDHAVITIPVHFSPVQRAAVLEAASSANIKKVALLQEPVAAALAHGLGNPRDQDLILVLDVGGGTFDVTILSSFEGIMEVVAFDGNQSLGGLDFDQAIAQWIIKQTGIEKVDTECQAHLHKLAERVKKEVLESKNSHFIFNDLTLSLTDRDFDSITQHLSKKFLAPILGAGSKALIDWHPSVDGKLTKSDPFQPPPKKITKVVFAGGSSTLPSLHTLVHHLTSLPGTKTNIDPKLCVAYGASIFAGMLEGSIHGIEIMDGAYSQDLHYRATGFI